MTEIVEILVMPATNATSERSFLVLRRVKTYLRSTMSQRRLNHLMTLAVHKEMTDKLELNALRNLFLETNTGRDENPQHENYVCLCDLFGFVYLNTGQ